MKSDSWTWSTRLHLQNLKLTSQTNLVERLRRKCMRGTWPWLIDRKAMTHLYVSHIQLESTDIFKHVTCLMICRYKTQKGLVGRPPSKYPCVCVFRMGLWRQKQMNLATKTSWERAGQKESENISKPLPVIFEPLSGIFVLICIHIHIYIYLYMSVYIYTYIYIYSVNVYIYTYIYVCIHIYVCIRIHIYINIHIYIYAYIWTYTYVYTYT